MNKIFLKSIILLLCNTSVFCKPLEITNACNSKIYIATISKEASKSGETAYTTTTFNPHETKKIDAFTDSYRRILVFFQKNSDQAQYMELEGSITDNEKITINFEDSEDDASSICSLESLPTDPENNQEIIVVNNKKHESLLNFTTPNKFKTMTTFIKNNKKASLLSCLALAMVTLNYYQTFSQNKSSGFKNITRNMSPVSLLPVCGLKNPDFPL